MFDFMKSFQNMRLGDPTMFAPKGPEGWQTGVQAEGSPMATTPEGAFSGFNPKVSDIGQAMQGAAEQMPGGAAVTSAMQGGQGQPQMPARPQKMGAFAPSTDQGPGPASWLNPFKGA